jgi:predicted PurR-regulated permease PerM
MMIGVARALADSLLQVILSLVVATMFWTGGDGLVSVLHDALRRLGGPIAERALDVAAGAIRGVAYGVVGTAAIQAVLLAIGLAVAGVPGATMLGFVALLLAISQIGGPLLVLIWGGAAWWLFAQDHQAWAVFTIIWGVFVSTVDNFIKPWLIGFGIEMPMSLTILGVFGGFYRLRLPGPVHRTDPDRHHVYLAAGMAGRDLRAFRRGSHDSWRGAARTLI